MHFAVGTKLYSSPPQSTADRSNKMDLVSLKEAQKTMMLRALRFVAKIKDTLLIRMTAQVHVIR